MKKIIYSFISDPKFGIKAKDDIKIKIFRILDRLDTKVSLEFDGPIEINNNQIENFNIFFITREDFDKEGITGTYDLTKDTKTLNFSLLPSSKNPNLVEDYTIIEHSNGVIEYKTRYGHNDNEVKQEYSYQGEEISEEEANKLLNPKTK